MQAMAMYNQAVVAPKPASPTLDNATYNDGASEDGFLPALQQASADVDSGEDLAGAAMATHKEPSQEIIPTEGGELPRPELVAPELVAPELVAPELVAPELVAPELVTPELVSPAPVSPALVTPEMVTPELVTPIHAQNGASLVVAELMELEPAVEEGANVDAKPLGLATQIGSETTIEGLDDEALVLPVERVVKQAMQSPQAPTPIVATRQEGVTVKPELQPALPVAVKDNNAVVTKSAQQVAVAAQSQGLPELNIPAVKKMVVQNGGARKINAFELKVDDGKTEAITDPRFAALLNKPAIGDSLRQQQGVNMPLISDSDQSGLVGTNKGVSVSDLSGLLVESSDSAVSSPAAGGSFEDLLSVKLAPANNGETASTPIALAQHGAQNTGHASAAEPVLPLRDGSTFPESRVVQQTIDHLTVHARGDSSSVTVKLHPEELGELQLRLVMEGDQLKVHLQAQSQQVQEVLERNFPRLRDALQEQGITVEDFQVSADTGESNEQQFSEQREFANELNVDPFANSDDADVDDLNAVLPAVAAMGGGRSLSVRV